MARYEADLTGISALIEVFPKGVYEFLIGEPKAYERPKRDAEGQEVEGQTIRGVRYGLKVTEVLDGGDSNAVGKRSVFNAMIHTEGAMGMTKQFLLAGAGQPRTPEGERAYNESHKGQDWSLDSETGAVGDVWREPTGKRVVVFLDTMANQRTGDPMQQFNTWYSLEGWAELQAKHGD